ncbi:hypothetical protein QOZ98_001353 [Planomicrobium stackebrandtii]|uniref:Uncharacterized protein n=1 Tax=Planomicrobium stackebrandtii TaxID=253160 RepID=A0ABU0GVE0_9BACL|nr:hypothetical protein [Planomicrobium stackebrandtii]MDQ0428527.1 hypothetical protein [Planomicrobium stackebrandtii]
MELFPFILSSILTSGIVATIITQIYETQRNKKNQKHSKNLQVDNFFRDISTVEMFQLLSDWHDLLYRRENEDITADTSTLVHRTFFYGSSETVRRLSLYQNYMYSIDTENNNREEEDIEEFARGAVLMSGIVVSLKKDFSDEEVSVIDLLRIYLPWYDEEEGFRKAVNNQIKLLEYD